MKENEDVLDETITEEHEDWVEYITIKDDEESVDKTRWASLFLKWNGLLEQED